MIFQHGRSQLPVRHRGEGGRPAIESYTELKTVLLPATDEMM
jgi:hypothetical protein